jgi:hypothetical protein
MSKAKSSAVILQGLPIYNEDGAAGETGILPGMLVSGVTTIIKHGVATGAHMRTFALEREEMGKGIEDAYDLGDTVKVGAFAPGDVVNAIIPSGQNISAGDSLASDGTGKLRESSTNPVGYSLDTLGAITADTRCRVRIA